MDPSSAPSRPKAPAERTFVVAVTLLSLAAVAQLVATAIALAPQLDLESLGRSLSARATSAALETAPMTGVPDVVRSREANVLMEEARQFRAEGNFDGALQAVSEADRLVPGRPGILLQMASDHVSSGRTPEAVAVLERIVALPPSADPADAPYREQARAALAQLGAAGTGAGTADQGAAAAPAAAGMRDDVGIPIGSVMGIVTAEMVDAEPGFRNLRLSTKAASSQKVDPQRFVATVDFYEQDDQGQIQHNDSPPATEWLSLPATWTNGEPEIFQTKYRLPLADRGDLPPLQYYGYVVAIYYNGELQDSRAEPVSLLDQFAPPLSKSNVE